jgi:PAS domain S-box-containing protein
MEVFPMSILPKRLLNKLGSGFFQLAEMSQDIFWIRSADFQTLLYVSPAYESVFKRNSQHLYRSSADWINAVVVEDRDRLRQRYVEWQANASTNNLNNIEYRITDDQGEIHWLNDSCFAVYDGRKCIAYAGVAKDLTSKKSRLREFDDACYFFRYFVDKIQGVFWVKDNKGKKQIFISPSYEKVWGLNCESLYANPSSWLESVLPEDLEDGKLEARFYDTSEQLPNKKHEFRFRIRHPNGDIRWIKDTHFPVMEKGELIGFCGIAEDVTPDVERENELREAKENAEKANRTKADFLAMMSHELRTPLNAVLGMAQILKISSLTEEQSDQIDVISQSGHHLLGLLNDLLDFAKLEVGKLSFSRDLVNLQQLVVKLIADMQSLARNKGLLLKYNYADNIPSMIIGDAKRIRQILVNLISNAIKFTDKGYVQLNINCLQKNHLEATLCFTVEDSGIGIEKSKLSTIFNRFQQVDSVYQRKHDGVGLGLAIVKEIVEKMSGNIAVTSEIGVGSQFSCIIPFPLQATATDSETTRWANEPRVIATETRIMPNEIRVIPNEVRLTTIANSEQTQFNIEVLVVEDNLINQKISKIMLEQIGCHVDIANCGQDAIEKMKKRYDMVFMDIGLPDMDGFEAVQHIRRSEDPGRHVPIVAMTAHVFEHDRERCFNVGMNEVLAKPIMQEELVRVLRRWAA